RRIGGRLVGWIAPLALIGRDVGDRGGIERAHLALRFRRELAGRRSLAHDQEDGTFVLLGAVPVHAVGEVGDEGASLHWHARVLVPGGTGADPPRAAEDEDEAVIRMEMRFREIVTLVPLGDAAVEVAFLGRVAPEARAIVRPRIAGVTPLVLLGRLVDERLRIELDLRLRDGGEADG